MRNDIKTDAAREAWIVTIAVECESAGRSGSWHVEATCAGPESRKSIELHDAKERTSQDDLQLRAAIAAIVEIRLVSMAPVTIRSTTGYLADGYDNFPTWLRHGGLKADGHSVRNWKRWKELWVLAQIAPVTFVDSEGTADWNTVTQTQDTGVSQPATGL